MVNIFSRLFYKKPSLDQIVPMVNKGQQQVLIHDDTFAQNCMKFSQKCQIYRKQFFWADVLFKLISTIIITMTGILGGLYGWEIGLISGSIGGTISVIAYIFGWPELKEKYANLKLEFIKLSASTNPDRNEVLVSLVMKMDHPILASDF